MGAWRIKKEKNPAKDRTARGVKDALTVSTITAITGFPILLAAFLMTIDMRPDLSDLRPAKHGPDVSRTLIGWPDLDGPSRKVRMLGYMMDGYTSSADGSQVAMFILMPEAGQILHAAHRIPSEMVEVWTRRPVTFRFRSLIWASGTLQGTGKGSHGEQALFALRDAEIENAQNREITRWFTE